MSNDQIPIKKNMLNMSLFSIIFIIFYYLINKINKKYDCFADVSSNPDINAAIVNAVNNKYKADVEAIRNLSSIAYALHKENNLIVPADLTILGTIKSNKIDLGYGHEGREGNSGKIEYGTFKSDALCIVGKGTNPVDRKVQLWDDVAITRHLNVGGNITSTGQINTMGKTNYPAGWGGGVRTFDLYVSASIGVGGEDAVCKTVINSDGINTNSLNVSGTIKNNYIDLGYGHVGREENAGKIEYNTIYDPNALCIVGKGTSHPNRKIHLWDDVTVDRNLNVIGNTTSKGQLNNMDKTNYPTNWWGGVRTFDIYASGTIGVGGEDAVCKTIINQEGIRTNNVTTTGQINTMGKTNYPAGWGGGVRTFDLYASASIGVGGEDAVCKTVINSDGINTNSLNVSGTIKNNYIDLGYGHAGREANAGKIEYNTPYDPDALCIVGKGTSYPNRKIHLWDDVTVDRNLKVIGELNVNSIKIGNWTIKEVDNRLIFSRNNQGLIMVSDGGCNRLRPLNGDCGSDGNGNHHFRIEW